MMDSEKKPNWSETIFPVVILSLLALFIPEILMGSTPVSRAEQWLLEWIFYGSGVLIIRETVVRFRLNNLAVFVLGLAYGILEEGVILQSVFNPGFLNLDLSYGRFWGVNWVWAQFIIVYHAVFSITVPILFSQMIFRRKCERPWLSKTGLGVVAGLYILAAVFHYYIFRGMSEYRVPASGIAVASLLAVVLILLALRNRKQWFIASSSKVVNPIVAGLVTGLALCLWLIGLREVFADGDGLPSWIIQGAGLLVAAILYGWFSINRQQKWSEKNQLAALTAAIMVATAFGFYIIIGSKNQADLIFQVVFAMGVLAGLIWFWLKTIKPNLKQPADF
jgi:hypothetical protein